MSETLTLSTNPPTVNPIRNTLSLLFKDGDPIIISSLRMQSDFMEKKAFASINEAEEFARALDCDPTVSNIYINLQQLRPGSTTDKRQDVAQYVRFLVDIDRTHKKVDGVRVNASEEERDALLEAAHKVSEWVGGILNARPLIADSANGFHLSWNLRPNAFSDAISPNEENKTTYKECLLAIKQRFDSESVEIDSSLSEPEQIIRLWGTHNRRDPETPSRPHRQSRILQRASGTVSALQLELLAGEYQAPTATQPTSKSDAPPLHEDFDEVAWWDHYSEIFTCEEERDGWQVTSICPATYEGKEFPGRRHTGSKFTGVRFDRGIAEFHCFSDDHCDMSFGQVMKHLNQYYPPFPGKIWDWGDDDLGDFAEDVTASDAMPEMASVTSNWHAESSKPKAGEFRFHTKRNIDGNSTIVGIRMTDIRTEKLEWLWPDKIPSGNITLFGGQPGCGKSIVLLDIIARTTSGRDWADGSKNTAGPRDVLLLASEDGEADTIKPRLIAAGADMSRIIVIRRVLLEFDTDVQHKSKHAFQLDEDISTLKHALKANPYVALVAVDPISAFFGRCDPNKDKEIRPVMEAIADAMDGTKCAFVGIIHNNKRGDADSISKILGASSVVGVARAVWGFGYDADDKTLRHMLLIKGNLSEKRTGMSYKLRNTSINLDNGEADGQPVCDWQGETDEDADDMLAKKREKAKNGGADLKSDAAQMMLRRELANGWRLLRDLHRIREKEGISESTMKRARYALGVIATKSAPWMWALPGTSLPGENDAEDPKMANPEVM
jgi:putative DNA primase/helicase